jgi:hypothetical protein
MGKIQLSCIFLKLFIFFKVNPSHHSIKNSLLVTLCSHGFCFNFNLIKCWIIVKGNADPCSRIICCWYACNIPFCWCLYFSKMMCSHTICICNFPPLICCICHSFHSYRFNHPDTLKLSVKHEAFNFVIASYSLLIVVFTYCHMLTSTVGWNTETPPPPPPPPHPPPPTHPPPPPAPPTGMRSSVLWDMNHYFVCPSVEERSGQWEG